MRPVVLIPNGKIAMGKLAQAIAHDSTILQVNGNFDDCLTLARDLATDYPVALVNSVNPFRIEGQKTGAFEVVDMLGDAPDLHVLPVGNAGNITAYWKGYREYNKDRISSKLPQMWGFQAAGSAPIVKNKIITNPETIATAIRIGNPASWAQAIEARDSSGGVIDSVTDREILAAYRLIAAKEGIFVEPSSAAGLAGLIKYKKAKKLPTGKKIVITVTGHGLKDVQWALEGAAKPKIVPVNAKAAAKALGL
jgi:threonine synthase